ncbi:MAG: caspase family protein [Oscillochloridaceae bacterium umkhey_bin13]
MRDAERLRTELAQLDQAIAALAGLPAAQAPLQQQRAAKLAELARLEGPGGTYVDQSGQSGGVSFGTSNQFGNVTIGDVAGGNIIKPQGPIIYGSIHSGRDTNLASGDQTIINRNDLPLSPPATSAAPRPRLRITDPTLSADGVHFTAGHALIIGVGQYRDPDLRSFATTANDARALGALLRDPQLAAYPINQVQVLVDTEATRAAILAALDAFAERVHGGTALIFFAGHGEMVGDRYVLLPYDTDSARLGETGIDAAVFHQRITQIRNRAKRLIVLLNCCHAGGVGDAVLGTSAATLSGAAPPPAFYEPLAVGSGQVVIASSRPTQKSGAVSQEQPQHTPFGAQLLAALRGAALGDGPALGVFELFAALRERVPADASHISYWGNPLRQEPLFYASQLDDNLAVALRPGWQGGTLSGDTLAQVRRIVEEELRRAAAG